MDNKTPLLEQRTWSQTPYKRVPWIRPGLKLGQTIKPFKDQDNPDIHIEAVMKPREEPVTNSNAFPLNTAGEKPTDGDTRRSHQDTTHDL